MARAQSALRDGRRLLALQRLAALEGNLAAAAWRPGAGPRAARDEAAFEAEWKRMGERAARPAGRAPRRRARRREPARRARARRGGAAAGRGSTTTRASTTAGTPLPDVRPLLPRSGARAARARGPAARSLSTPAGQGSRRPCARSSAEIDALEAELLAAYRPPASIDSHRDFIRASAALKEARELDAAGLRYGALLRYLQALAALRAARGRRRARRRGPDRRAACASYDARLAARERRPQPSGGCSSRSPRRRRRGSAAGPRPRPPAIADDVLPRYFAALEPARPAAAAGPRPRVTVTLVRWPYT